MEPSTPSLGQNISPMPKRKTLSEKVREIVGRLDQRASIFSLLFAVVGGFWIFSSYAATGVPITYGQMPACINPLAGEHKFIHSGSCTKAELSRNNVNSGYT